MTARPAIVRVLALAAVLGATACGDTTGNTNAAVSVSIQPAADTIVAGDSLSLTATVLDRAGNVLTDRPVTWTSSDTGIIRVRAIASAQLAVATGIGRGSARVVATAEQASDTAVVTVTSHPVAGTWTGLVGVWHYYGGYMVHAAG